MTALSTEHGAPGTLSPALPPRPFRLLVSLSRVTLPELRKVIDDLIAGDVAAAPCITLYEQRCGTYPRIMPDGTREHGGLPRTDPAFLAAHFAKVREDVKRLVPAGFTGHVVLDYEVSPVLAWTPPRYQEAWKAANPAMTPEQRAAEWGRRVVILHTLSMGLIRDTLRDHAPGATCGFYGYFDGSALPVTDPPIEGTVDNATALYPSWYAPEPLGGAGGAARFAAYVRECAASMERCRALFASRPVYPFLAGEHTGLGRDGFFLTGTDTRRALATAWRLGAAGVVLWGDMRSEAHQRDQAAWLRGPFLRAWREVANPARAAEVEAAVGWKSLNAEGAEAAEKRGGGA